LGLGEPSRILPGEQEATAVILFFPASLQRAAAVEAAGIQDTKTVKMAVLEEER
jgi:hypothetical protein